MDYNVLTALPLTQAEELLKGVKYAVRRVGSNLKGADVCAVAAAREEEGILTLYVCDFKLLPGKNED